MNKRVSKYIICVLEYASPLFVGISDALSKRLESIQKRAHKIFCGCPEYKCVPTIEDRRKVAGVKLFMKMCDTEHMLFDIIPQRSGHGRYILPIINTNRFLNSFVLYTCINLF